MQNNITERVEALRQWMRRQEIEAYIVPTMDPHGSEYVPAHWQTRQWLTGFTGSAGTAVVTLDDARMWTDSRYWLQGERQLKDTPFQLMRDLADTPICQWLQENVQGAVGFLPMVTPAYMREEFFQGVDSKPIEDDPFDALWTDRPAFPLSMAERMPDELAGETAASKLQRLENWLKDNGEQQVVVRDLSEIAWTLNLRGDDIPYNPFLISFLRVQADGQRTLYIHKEQLTAEIQDYLSELCVATAPYDEAPWQMETPTPIPQWRAVKTAAEQEGFRQAHLRDGVAMVRFLRLLDEWGSEPWTELRVDRELTALRAQQPGFRGLSFETIAGYAANGAVVHYEPTPETDTPLLRCGLLLLDSGAHYDCGTTDITRTIPLGPVTEEERRVFTLVLKGHLQLQNMVFPRGTTGLQLDTAARMPLWRAGLDFGHGTGHGVGHRLGVHEGPVQIRKNCRPDTTRPLLEGQNITDEPGVYVEGKFGVRHENTLLCVAAEKNAFGDFLKFEPLTRCPYDLRAVDVDLLTSDERRWLNEYHALVARDLLPLLEDEVDRQWLRNATRAI